MSFEARKFAKRGLVAGVAAAMGLMSVGFSTQAVASGVCYVLTGQPGNLNDRLRLEIGSPKKLTKTGCGNESRCEDAKFGALDVRVYEVNGKLAGDYDHAPYMANVFGTLTTGAPTRRSDTEFHPPGSRLSLKAINIAGSPPIRFLADIDCTTTEVGRTPRFNDNVRLGREADCVAVAVFTDPNGRPGLTVVKDFEMTTGTPTDGNNYNCSTFVDGEGGFVEPNVGAGGTPSLWD
jgi:hypothetical protein